MPCARGCAPSEKDPSSASSAIKGCLTAVILSLFGDGAPGHRRRPHFFLQDEQPDHRRHDTAAPKEDTDPLFRSHLARSRSRSRIGSRPNDGQSIDAPSREHSPISRRMALATQPMETADPANRLQTVSPGLHLCDFAGTIRTFAAPPVNSPENLSARFSLFLSHPSGRDIATSAEPTK